MSLTVALDLCRLKVLHITSPGCRMTINRVTVIFVYGFCSIASAEVSIQSSH